MRGVAARDRRQCSRCVDRGLIVGLPVNLDPLWHLHASLTSAWDPSHFGSGRGSSRTILRGCAAASELLLLDYSSFRARWASGRSSGSRGSRASAWPPPSAPSSCRCTKQRGHSSEEGQLPQLKHEDRQIGTSHRNEGSDSKKSEPWPGKDRRYYNVILAWTLYYTFRTLGALVVGAALPWDDQRQGYQCRTQDMWVKREVAAMAFDGQAYKPEYRASFWCGAGAPDDQAPGQRCDQRQRRRGCSGRKQRAKLCGRGAFACAHSRRSG